jgi:hypothetical protein
MWLDHGVENGVAWCTAISMHSGTMVGYAMLPTTHPWHGVDCIDIDWEDGCYPDVHGGVTYCDAGPEGSWWVGFDCHHAWDAHNDDWLSEESKANHAKHPDLYADFGDQVLREPNYVAGEARKLAQQLTKKGTDAPAPTAQ